MSYLKFTPYIYLVFGIYLIYDGFTKISDSNENPWFSFVFAGLAVFMFFFRMKFAKKFEDRNKKA
jgi:hypothetical protein|nr:hypothetical protein [uncultured Flavobacterium sp.]